MSQYMTSNSLIESVKIRASVPENQATYTAEDFLQLANEEMINGLVPSIMKLHEDYLLYEQDTPIVEGKLSYEIPYRAVGNKLRDVQFKTDDGNFVEMTRISIGERFHANDIHDYNSLRKYYLRHNSVVLSPEQQGTTSGNLTFIYYIRPSELVTEERIGIISGINRNTGEIVLTSFPENFTSTTRFDFYTARSPHRILSIDLEPMLLNSTSLSVTFDPALIPDDLQIGDHLSQSCEAIIPQIPSDLHSVLAHRVAMRMLESMGDTEGLSNATRKLAEMEMNLQTLIDSRVDDAPQKIVNRHGLLRAGVNSKNINKR